MDWFQDLKWWTSHEETEIRKYLNKDYPDRDWVPDRWDKVYRAFHLTPLDKVKVVILGQDPYPNPDYATGLAFSTQNDAIPPSLRNIYSELCEDITTWPIRKTGSLESWATQGVLLFNSRLTTRKYSPGSHKGIGWEVLTNEVLNILFQRQQPVVFILWGKDAQESFDRAVGADNNEQHLVLRSSHPSPLSAHTGFFGSRPFSQCNAFLRSKGIDGIDWNKE